MTRIPLARANVLHPFFTFLDQNGLDASPSRGRARDSTTRLPARLPALDRALAPRVPTLAPERGLAQRDTSAGGMLTQR